MPADDAQGRYIRELLDRGPVLTSAVASIAPPTHYVPHTPDTVPERWSISTRPRA
jgi:hypothetical protein